MSIPLDIRVAIALASPVACPHCGPVEVVPDEVLGRPQICHPRADCELYLHPDSGAALVFARSVDEEIGRYAVLGDYCEPESVHAWGMP